MKRYPKTETVSEKVDWIAFTCPFYKDLSFPDFVSSEWKEINPIAHFNKGKENKQGVRVYWHTERPANGRHVIMSGTTLIYFQGREKDIFLYLFREGYRITRVDFCLDVVHSNINIKNATYHIEKRQVKTHAKQFPTWFDAAGSGYTQYIGKKTSETYCRIYDKASEMGTDHEWARVEVVFNGDRCAPAVSAYLGGASCGAIIKAFVDFPKWRKWGKIMGSATATVRVPTKQTNTREWLLGQVAKSLAREMALDDDQDFYLTFLQKVREEYYALSEKGDIVTSVNF